jgi:hypothetical protein
VTSAFESWQVFCHSDWYLELHILVLYVIIAGLLSPCIAYVVYVVYVPALPTLPTSIDTYCMAVISVEWRLNRALSSGVTLRL